MKRTKQLAEVLKCVCFHRNVGTSQEKSQLLKQLTDNTQQVFTATNALGLGVDAPHIRVIIHVGQARKLRDYAQESGRAGRNGSPSEAIILQDVRINRRDGSQVPEGFGQDVNGDMKELTRRSVLRSPILLSHFSVPLYSI